MRGSRDNSTRGQGELGVPERTRLQHWVHTANRDQLQFYLGQVFDLNPGWARYVYNDARCYQASPTYQYMPGGPSHQAPHLPVQYDDLPTVALIFGSNSFGNQQRRSMWVPNSAAETAANPAVIPRALTDSVAGASNMTLLASGHTASRPVDLTETASIDGGSGNSDQSTVNSIRLGFESEDESESASTDEAESLNVPVKRSRSPSVHEDEEQDGPVTKRLKASRRPQPERLAVCQNCGCPYDTVEDRDQLCIYHPGSLERDEKQWKDIDDFGSISDRDQHPDFPDLYYWKCCKKPGDDMLGCTRGVHSDLTHQTKYAEQRLAHGHRRVSCNNQPD